MKLILLLLALAGCTMERPQPISDSIEQPWFCGDYEAEGEEAPKGCVREPGRESRVERERRLMCTGPTEVIADDDPALAFFRTDEGLSLETRKEALAIERVNSCD